jgi:hypothetical protein
MRVNQIKKCDRFPTQVESNEFLLVFMRLVIIIITDLRKNAYVRSSAFPYHGEKYFQADTHR